MKNKLYLVFADVSRYDEVEKIELFLVTDDAFRADEMLNYLREQNYKIKLVRRELNEISSDYISQISRTWKTKK